MTVCIKSHIEEHDTFAKHLGITIVEAEPGHAVTMLPLDQRHKNGVSIAHGGALFALADLAFAAASNACMGSSGAMLNVTSSITYIKAGEVGPITAEATEIHAGGRLGTYQIRVCDGNGDLLAVSTITGYRTQHPVL